jgi:hypothetical protein
MRHRTPRQLAFVLAALAACSDRPMSPTGEGGVGAAPGPAADAASAITPDAADDHPTPAPMGHGAAPDAAMLLDLAADGPSEAGSPSEEFRKIYESLLRPTCGGPGRFCHANELLATKLDFNTLEKAFANLVNVPTALTCASTWPSIRVVPFDPEASAIMYARTDVCSLRHGIINYKVDLTPIEAWIRAGAR